MGIPRYIRLLLRPPALNLDEAAWELVNTVRSPRKMYKSLYFRQQTRQKWAREDPSFIIFFFALLCLSSILWGLTYAPTFAHVFKLFWYMVFIDFVFVGLVVSTLAYMVINRYGTVDGPHAPLEWAFCFDVHCNSFVCVWLWLYLVEYVLSPVVLHHYNWAATIIGNLLYLVAVSHYLFISFLGYSMLPFVKKTEVLFVPILMAFGAFLLCTLCKFNFAQFMADGYLSWVEDHSTQLV